jgi:hypothetical protein
MRSFFVGAHRGIIPVIDAVKGAQTARIDTSAEDFLKQLESGDDRAVVDRAKRLLRNKVKKCGACGKPNGFTLSACNSCGNSLKDVEISHSTNVFTSFMFGIARGPFPLTISIRRETEYCLVMDDLLALSPLHFNVIPTTAYIPDWRYLLRRPAEGLQLIGALMRELLDTAKEQFLSNDAWRRAAIAHGHQLHDGDFIAGFNFPPSQYQLHIQFMAPMLLPFQRYQYLKGVHYTHGRFFPFHYVARCLDAARSDQIPLELLQEDTPVEAIVQHALRKWGVNYDEEHARLYAKAGADYATFANWRREEFDGTARENEAGELKVLQPHDGSEEKQDAGDEIQRLINDDKVTLQNYGRPYDDKSKPSGSFYHYAKDFHTLEMW